MAALSSSGWLSADPLYITGTSTADSTIRYSYLYDPYQFIDKVEQKSTPPGPLAGPNVRWLEGRVREMRAQLT